MMKVEMRTVALVASLAGLSSATMTASADVVTLTGQQRETVAFVIVPPCGSPQSDFNQEQAEDFKPFTSDITAELTCKVAGAMSSASQSSAISPTILSASGVLYNDADSDVSAILHSISRSVYEVTFDVASEVTYTIEGTITVAGNALPSQMADASGRVRLVDAGGTMLINEFVKTTPGVSEYTLDIDLEGTLEPGQYTFRTRIDGIIDAYVGPEADVHATYDVVMTIGSTNAADLNGDGVVDGADLLILLSAWGECADPEDCPADLNEDGVVDGADLLILLANWG